MDATATVHGGRIFARVLSRPIFASLARGSAPKVALKFVGASKPLKCFRTLRDLFDAAYDELESGYRNEYVYKTVIADKIVFGLHSPETSSLHIEQPVARSIVDVAVFNGTSTAYEIKTEFDTPRRLVTQTYDYLRVFQRVYVVTHASHVSKYLATCDRRVGVYALRADNSLTLERESASSNEFDSRTMFRMLRRSEYVAGLLPYFGLIKQPNAIIAEVCERLFAELTDEQQHAIFIDSMRSRTTDHETVAFVKSLPAHLRVLGYSTPLSKPQRARILDLLNAPIR